VETGGSPFYVLGSPFVFRFGSPFVFRFVFVHAPWADLKVGPYGRFAEASALVRFRPRDR